MNDTHDELLKAFRQYFEANQKWINEQTRVAGMDARFWLSEIRRICSRRRVEIQDWRHEVDRAKRERKAAHKKAADSDASDT